MSLEAVEAVLEDGDEVTVLEGRGHPLLVVELLVDPLLLWRGQRREMGPPNAEAGSSGFVVGQAILVDTLLLWTDHHGPDEGVCGQPTGMGRGCCWSRQECCRQPFPLVVGTRGRASGNSRPMGQLKGGTGKPHRRPNPSEGESPSVPHATEHKCWARVVRRETTDSHLPPAGIKCALIFLGQSRARRAQCHECILWHVTENKKGRVG